MPCFDGRDLTCLRGARIVFAGLNFQIAAGGALVLTGPNGSGKSSLLRLMAGLSHPIAGLLCWDDRPVADDPEKHRARLRYVGHLDMVKPVLSAQENLTVWAELDGAPDPEGRAQAALARWDLGHLARLPGRYLSAGQKRRLNLARLALMPVPLWLLDEPATSLDRTATARLAEEIARHRAGGGMVVLSTHTDLDLDAPCRLNLSDFAAQPAGTGLDGGDMPEDTEMGGAA